MLVFLIAITNKFPACMFYDLTPVLIPSDVSPEGLEKIIIQTQADSIVAPGGVLSIDSLTKIAPKTKLVVWVVPSTSRQMDFTEGSGTSGPTAEWHGLINQSQAVSDLPKSNDEKHTPNVISVWHDESSTQTVEYTQAVCFRKNLVLRC